MDLCHLQIDRQAEDRCHRLGQPKPVTVIRLVRMMQRFLFRQPTEGCLTYSLPACIGRRCAFSRCMSFP